MCFLQECTKNQRAFNITSELDIYHIELLEHFTFILLPNEEVVDVSIVGDLGRGPGDLYTVWLNLAKAQVSGGWYSY